MVDAGAAGGAGFEDAALVPWPDGTEPGSKMLWPALRFCTYF